jgi:effector-binding domain-containing protein
MSTTPVSLQVVAPRPTAVVARTTTWEEFPGLWPRLLDEVYVYVRAHADLAPETGPEVWRNVFLFADDTPTVEVGVLVARSFERHGDVVASQLPGGTVATAVHRGDYAELGRTHDAVRAFAATQGLERAGPRWEIYGHWREDPGERETEVHYLIR